MPYKTNNDLPDAVKNSLPAEAQTVFRKAFNSAFEQYEGDEEKANAVAWSAVKTAGWQKNKDGNWVKTNAQLDIFAKKFDLEAEIFSAGKWNGDTYSEKDLQDIVENFNELREKVKPPVKLGHAWKEGQPALGWVESLRIKGEKLIAKITDVPEIVYNAIKDGRYKRVSAEIYWNFKAATGKTYNYVLKAVALLGADIPAVDNLEDLTAYLTQISNIGSFERAVAYEFDTVSSAGEIQFYIKQEKHEVKKMADKEIKEFEDRIDKLQKNVDAEKSKREAAEAKVLEFEKEKQKAAAAKRESEFKEFCEKMVKDGCMLPAERDRLFKQIDEFNADDKGFLIPFESFKTYAEKHKAILDKTEKGVDSDKNKKEYASASAELADRAKKYSREKSVDYEKAVAVVLADDPELAKRYKDE